MPASTDKPELVTLSDELKSRFQSGNDDGMIEVILRLWPLIAEEFASIIDGNDARTLTYAAPQIADLASRIGWLRK